MPKGSKYPKVVATNTLTLLVAQISGGNKLQQENLL